MPDLTKFVTRAKQALERRQYDMAIEVLQECIDYAPDELEIHSIHLDAARRKAKESASSRWSLPKMSMPVLSKDPHKQMIGAFKKLASSPDNKGIAEAGDAALKLSQTVKSMSAVAIYYYEEIRKSGMFNDKALWNLGHAYFERFGIEQKRDPAAAKTWLEKAINTMSELERNMPLHPEAPKVVKNWEAQRSIIRRNEGGDAGEYRSQLSSDVKARKAEKMNANIRTKEDAEEVQKYIDEDLLATPKDKALWVKKGDIHFRMSEWDKARAAFDKAQEIDAHDFTVTMRLGDISMFERRQQVEAMEAAGKDVTEARKELHRLQAEEYKRRVQRQPTDLNHRQSLGLNLFALGQIDAAAAEFQRTVNDPKYRKDSHRYLGDCFIKKNLLDLSAGQYAAYLQLIEDEQADESKDVRYKLGRVLESLGKKADAINQFEKLVAIDLSYRDAADRLTKLRSGQDT